MTEPLLTPFPHAKEHNEQVALIKWWNRRAPDRVRMLLLAIPNGGKRDAVTGAILKSEGVRPGVPDLFLAVPNKGRGGLFIEMKRRAGGKVSREQREMLACLSCNGYAAAVCKGWHEARAVICDYLGWRKEV